jgi:hypothetical protein
MQDANASKIIPCSVTPAASGKWSVIDGVLVDERLLFTAKAIPQPLSEARLQFKTGSHFTFHVLDHSKRLGADGWTLNWYLITLGE